MESDPLLIGIEEIEKLEQEKQLESEILNNVNGNGIEIEYIESDISNNINSQDILDKIELHWIE